MQILNKTVNVRDDICFRASSNGKVYDFNKEHVENIIAAFEQLGKEDKSIANIEDLKMAHELSREKKMIRIKQMADEQRMQKNAGFALISSVTIIGTLVMGLIIFMAVKAIIIG